MKRKLLTADGVLTLLIIVLAGILYITYSSKLDTEESDMHQVALNEILQLSKQAELPSLEDKIEALSSSLKETETDSSGTVIIFCGTGMVVLLQLILIYIYHAILAPFERMKKYTEEIARGNFDLTLPYDRANYFGAFTWAFDHMRLEINRARSCEQVAIENNKTTIATLSHDIKTPIASIRAYAEGLEANLNTNAEMREYYLQVIVRKCDEVTQLTNDLFYHSLADLDKLSITLSPIKIVPFLEEAVREFSAGKDDIHLFLEQHEINDNAKIGSDDQTDNWQNITILGDEQRLTQVLGNLITNVRKYAKTKIDLTCEVTEDEVRIILRDYGEGIPNEDIPFACDRFYRGKNCGPNEGAGLGLYIVDYLMKQMNGGFELRNLYPGLKCTLILKKEIS